MKQEAKEKCDYCSGTGTESFTENRFNTACKFCAGSGVKTEIQKQ